MLSSLEVSPARSLLIGLAWLGLTGSVAGCVGGPGKPEDTGVKTVVTEDDQDGDGFSISQGDCNDQDEAISPGTAEECDGIDQNCDGQVDEGVTLTFYVDDDGDGFGDEGTPVQGCGIQEGWSELATDCDDGRADVYPGATEVCDGADQDCDGEIDDGVLSQWYYDADGDGFGDPLTTELACTAPPAYVADDTDCDDSTEDAFPGNPEVCDQLDNDCNGLTDDGVLVAFYADLDGDGYGNAGLPLSACVQPAGYVTDATDCDDYIASTFPGAPEFCNGVDDDCNGTIDDDYALDADLWYSDADGDGFGDAGAVAAACSQPAGYLADDTDCDPLSAANYPGADEWCDAVDNDCDGDVDEPESLDAYVWYADGDGDGYGDARVSQISCLEPGGFVVDATDCNDGAANANPGELEFCDLLDNDCDGVIDEDSAVDAITWYADADNDSFGDPAVSVSACAQPVGYESDALDCDDASISLYPGAPEYCDGVDNDCDGTTDESSSVDTQTYYLDSDGDGYGDAGRPIQACTQPAGYAVDFRDCDDGDGGVYPGAVEICDGRDEDCDSVVDDGATSAATWYLDADGDGYGNASIYVVSCAQPTGYVLDSTDCSDVDTLVNPGLSELCNGFDDDCDGVADEGGSWWYMDADGDGHGNPNYAVQDCAQPPGYAAAADDCDDGSSASYSGAAESCDLVDNDCDGTTDEGVIGSGSACPAESCLDIYQDRAPASGTYWVEANGAAAQFSCDMTSNGGGWTLIFSDTFEAGANAGWSMGARYTCGGWSTILGGYGNIAGGSVRISLSAYSIPHTQSWISLDYIALDSWDGETAYVQQDGSTFWSRGQNNHSTGYSEVCGWNRGYYGSYDSLWPISSVQAHSSNSLTLTAGSTLNQSSTDESFGIDDVYVWIR